MEKFSQFSQNSFEKIKQFPRLLASSLLFFGAYSCSGPSHLSKTKDIETNIVGTDTTSNKLIDLSIQNDSLYEVNKPDTASYVDYLNNVKKEDIVSTGDNSYPIDSKKELVNEIKVQKEWLINYMESSMFKERLILELKRSHPDKETSFYEEQSKRIVEERKNNLLNGNYVLKNKLNKDGKVLFVGKYKPEEVDYTNTLIGRHITEERFDPRFDPPKGDVAFEKTLSKAKHSKGVETTPVHEFTHQSTDGETLMIPQSSIDIHSYMKTNFMAIFKDTRSGILSGYLDNPSEVYSRLNELRFLLDKYHIYDPSKDIFTEEHFEKLIRIKEIRENERVKEIFENTKDAKEALLWLMNNIAQIESMVSEDVA